MLGFARNIVFLKLNGASTAEKIARVRDNFGFRGSPRVSRIARAVDASRWLFLFFDDAVLLCIACVETLCA